MKRSFVFLMIVLLAVLPLFASSAAGDSVQHNGFEEEESHVWKKFGNVPSGYSYDFDSTFSRTGNRSFKFSSENPAPNAGYNIWLSNNGVNNTPNFAVEENKEYKIGFWYYAKGYKRIDPTVGAYMYVRSFKGSQGIGTDTRFYIPEGDTSEWKHFVVRYITKPGADRLQINLGIRAVVGEIWMDDITVKPVDPNEANDLGSLKIEAVDQSNIKLTLSGADYTDRLDEISFGNPVSESMHQLTAVNSVSETGAMNEPSRKTLPPTGSLTFRMKVDPNKQNYVTVKFWGSDTGEGSIFLKDAETGSSFVPEYGSPWPELDYMLDQPALPGRFFYSTYMIPKDLTEDRTELTMKLETSGYIFPYAPKDQWYRPQKQPSRGIYRAYTHTDPYFIPIAEPQGTAPEAAFVSTPGSGLSPYDYLVEQLNIAVDKVLSFQKIGPAWEKMVAEGRSPAMATGAITHWYSDLFTGTEDEWKSEAHSRTIGSNTLHLTALSLLAAAYEGKWSNHYHDDDLVVRVAFAMDYLTRAQGSNGGFIGRTPWIGGPDRQEATNPLEGFGHRRLGEAFVRLYDRMEQLRLLDVKIDNDNDPSTPEITRREAYARMFENSRSYMVRDPGRIANQEINNMLGMYFANESLKRLSPETAWSDDKVYDYLYKATGVKKNVIEYTISPKGIPMEFGYDGSYGKHTIEMLSDLARYTEDPQLIARAAAATNAFAKFKYLSTDAQGKQVLLQDQVISNRNNWGTGKVQYALSTYGALKLGLPAALRELQLFFEHGVPYGYNFGKDDAHYYEMVPEVLDLVENMGSRHVDHSISRPEYVQAILNAFHNPPQSADQMNRHRPSDVVLPLEPEAPDDAFSDEVANAVSVKNGEDQLLMSLNWRKFRTGIPTNIARIHYSKPGISYVANVKMSSPYGINKLYIAKYGDYVIVMNASETETYNVQFAGKTRTAKELIGRREIDLSKSYSLPPLTSMVICLSR
jgi:hypothetical protein